MKETYENLKQLVNKLESLWLPYSSVSVDGSPTGIYEVLLLFKWVGQPSKNSALPEQRLAVKEISEGRRKEYATASTGRKAQNPRYLPYTSNSGWWKTS